MSKVLWKKSFGKKIFPILAGKLMSRNFKLFIGRHFETVRPIFDYFIIFFFDLFCLVLCFLSTLPVNQMPTRNFTNTCTEDLGHFSVKSLLIFKDIFVAFVNGAGSCVQKRLETAN